MSSILTNAGAMTALQSLSSVNKNLDTTQNRISTGQRVSEASHNAAYWSIATTMRSDNKANSVVKDALGLGAGKIDVAYTGMEQAIEMVDQIKEKVTLAKSSGEEDRAKIQTEIGELQAGLEDMIAGANYAGSNLLADGEDIDIMTSYNRADDGTVSTGAITITGADIQLSNADGDTGLLAEDQGSGQALLAMDVTGYDDAGFDAALGDIESVLSGMSDAAATLGAAKSRVDTQRDFVDALSDAIDRGVGTLVDADMEEESTRLQALQTQQQLGIQALSIANANSQNILGLFR